MSRLTEHELEQLVKDVHRRCDRPTRVLLDRLCAEAEELRSQAAERQHMYDIEPET